MNKELTSKTNYPTLYSLFGIYVDWQIDNNLIKGLRNDPHGINSFQDFLEKSRWQIVEIEYNGQKMLSLNLNLPKLKLLNMLKISVVRVVKSKLPEMDVAKILERYEKKLNLPCFDIFQYYMTNAPWNLVSRSVMNDNPDKMVIDESLFNNRIIIKVMTKDGCERITSANDILSGAVIESEYLIDSKLYNDETSYDIEKYWSEKLCIPVLGSNDEIDYSYKYPKESSLS